MVLCWLAFVIFLLFSVVLYILGVIFLFKGLELFIELELLSFNSLSVEFAICVDWISLMFSSFVFFISSMIMIYSSVYMSEDKSMGRFVYLMVLFVLSMVVVIMSTNLVFVLLGWDGLGLVSYVLVIYYQNSKSSNAGMLTALSNRIGDASILLGIAIMVSVGGWSYSSVLGFLSVYNDMILLSFLIVLAAMTKSAQIPFSSWLPAAMSAPTPVSSLVHSSTLVTAGVYLLFRFSDSLSLELKVFLFYISALTMFMASLGANFEFDLKKIIALSTLSQLGMMMVIFCLGEKELAFFHLLMHALFKALLFMCAGVIIHSVGGNQDIRCMGGLVRVFPITSVCFCISSFALCGLPFLSGFYSKDLVVEVLSMSVSGWFVYLVFFFSVGLTVSYSIRLFLYVFVGRFNMVSLSFISENESKIMLYGMLPLVVLVILEGSVLSWLSFSSPYFIVLPLFMKLMTVFMIFMGGLMGYEGFFFFFIWNSGFLKFYYFSMFVSGMWNLSILSTSKLNLWALSVGKVYLKNLDFGWSEYYGSKGLFSLIKSLVIIFQLIVRNHLKLFLMLLWGGVLIMIFFN
uniref:NADH-ubiquinone oxidoreductase chain 5 n=1 Tax=Trigonopterus singkawangensis TaxID=1729343 RepID=A0A7H1KHZ9_9CUCU|nr:NADH dehydrogenase subunit 5 [Trigonopterus singkawangensis]QNT26915.1 NADH dehydrogenase subunit 5 [Trigonopterus singkawangensis]